MADDILTFIRAALDRDAQLAQACPPWPWRIRYDDDRHIPANLGCRRGMLLDANESAPTLVVSDPYGEVGPAHEHIARHDPARTLRKVVAMREILGMYEASALAVTDLQAHLAELDEVDWRRFERAKAQLSVLGDVLFALAQSYDGELGFRDEWRARKETG